MIYVRLSLLLVASTISLLQAQILNYNTIVEITASNAVKLWTFPSSKVWGSVINAGNPDVNTNKDMYEVLVGAPKAADGSDDRRLTTGPQYFMLRAADGAGKAGAIQYNDTIEIYALSTKNTSGFGWSDNHNANFADLSRKLFVNNGAYWGPGWGQVLVGRVNNPLLSQDSGRFTVVSASGATGSVKQGDKVKLVFSATGKNVWAFGASLYGNSYGTLLVGDTVNPDRSTGDACNFTIAEPSDKSESTYVELCNVLLPTTTTVTPTTATTTTTAVSTTVQETSTTTAALTTTTASVPLYYFYTSNKKFIKICFETLVEGKLSQGDMQSITFKEVSSMSDATPCSKEYCGKSQSGSDCFFIRAFVPQDNKTYEAIGVYLIAPCSHTKEMVKSRFIDRGCYPDGLYLDDIVDTLNNYLNNMVVMIGNLPYVARYCVGNSSFASNKQLYTTFYLDEFRDDKTNFSLSYPLSVGAWYQKSSGDIISLNTNLQLIATDQGDVSRGIFLPMTQEGLGGYDTKVRLLTAEQIQQLAATTTTAFVKKSAGIATTTPVGKPATTTTTAKKGAATTTTTAKQSANPQKKKK